MEVSGMNYSCDMRSILKYMSFLHCSCLTACNIIQDNFHSSSHLSAHLNIIYVCISGSKRFSTLSDTIASYLPTGLHLGFFRSWPSLFLPSSFSLVFLVLSFVLASTSLLFWAVFLLPFFEHGHIMRAGSFQSLL